MKIVKMNSWRFSVFFLFRAQAGNILNLRAMFKWHNTLQLGNVLRTASVPKVALSFPSAKCKYVFSLGWISFDLSDSSYFPIVQHIYPLSYFHLVRLTPWIKLQLSWASHWALCFLLLRQLHQQQLGADSGSISPRPPLPRDGWSGLRGPWSFQPSPNFMEYFWGSAGPGTNAITESKGWILNAHKSP